MTIDEAIKICEEDAEKIGGNPQSDRHAERCRQLAEWLRELKTRRTQLEKICIELSELFGCPCNFSPMDEIMTEAEGCVEDCGDVNDSECWRRYFKMKGLIGEDEE